MNTDPRVQTAILADKEYSLVDTLRLYWMLLKSTQTALLVITGLGGYMSVRPPDLSWGRLLALAGSLFLAIGGSTMLNMVYDRDVDARMQRTAGRPIPSGRIAHRSALRVGLVLSAGGVLWALSLAPLYGLIVLCGLVFDVVIYTLWLKRRTPWSILWGGISGGMPILAGRVLSLGHIDPIGILLALGVLTWIPSHIMPLTIKYLDEYRQARIPTFPDAYGLGVTRAIVSFSISVTVVMMLITAQLSSIVAGYLIALGLLGSSLLALAVVNVALPSPRLNLGLFKFASLYMLGAMVLIIVG